MSEGIFSFHIPLVPDCASKLIRIAVMSDLHCRLSTDPNDSFLVVGELRIPVDRHPVSSLIALIEEQKIEVDALLVPGDLSNKARKEGLSQGWDFALEIGHALKSKVVVPTIGNHDIESRRTEENQHRNPTYFARNLRPGFPFPDQDACSQFFAEGFCVIDLNAFSQLVLI
jgi:metallophosphoesterase superfamily enzyme